MKYKTLIKKYGFSENEIDEIKLAFTFNHKLIYDKKYLSKKHKKSQTLIKESSICFRNYLKKKKWRKYEFKTFNNMLGNIFYEFLNNNYSIKSIVLKHIQSEEITNFINIFFKETGLWDEIYEMLCCFLML